MNALSVRLILVVVCGFAGAAADAAIADTTVVPLEGEPFTASLSSAGDGKLVFLQGETGKSLSTADLLRYGDFVEPRKGPIWLLGDGGVLVTEIAELEKDNLRGESLLLGKISLPIAALKGILVRPPGDKSRRDALVASILSAPGDNDRLVLDNGDELVGTIEAVTHESIGLMADGKRIDVELPRIAAILFNPSLAEKPELPKRYLMLGFSDGSRLVAESLTADAKEVSFSSAGHAYKARSNALVAVQVMGNGAVYLSDMKELSFKHVSYLDLSWPLRKDANVLDRPLRVDGKRYLKGLGMHSASRVAYKLDGPYKEFQAELAIDDSASGRGSATCSVFVDDGSGKWQQRYTSPIVRGGEKPLPVRVDLSGVKAISLLCDFADHGDQLDHVDWLNARVVK